METARLLESLHNRPPYSWVTSDLHAAATYPTLLVLCTWRCIHTLVQLLFSKGRARSPGGKLACLPKVLSSGRLGETSPRSSVSPSDSQTLRATQGSPFRSPTECELMPLVKLKLTKRAKVHAVPGCPGAIGTSQPGKASHCLYTALCSLEEFSSGFRVPHPASLSLFYSGGQLTPWEFLLSELAPTLS